MKPALSLTKQKLAIIFLLMSFNSMADVLSFKDSDFALTPAYGNVQTFEFAIDLAGVLTAGSAYANPALNQVDYSVFGSITNTPSGFPAFNLIRSIGGAEFYSQGSSLSFEIDGSADLSDGLQVAELVGTTNVFVFNGREVGTGRYHPSLLVLNSDGTGSIRNSNNMGGINPGSGMEVDVDFGDEFITDLSFNPNTLTIAIPEPSVLGLLAAAGIGSILARHIRR